MPIITIAREYGAGGSTVAALLAERTGLEIVDRSLIAEVARRAGLPAEEVADEDEHGRSLLDRIVRAFVPLADTVGAGALTAEDFGDHHALIESVTRTALREAARSGHAIIVGRGAAAELRDAPGTLHVFLWAPLADRARFVQEREACDAATAERRIHEVDGKRMAYVREVYGVDWRSRELYDLVVNTGRLGHTRTAETILAALGVRAQVSAETAGTAR